MDLRVRLYGLEEKLVLGLCHPVNGTGSPQDDCTSGRLHLRTIHTLTFFNTSSKHKSLNHESKNNKKHNNKKHNKNKKKKKKKKKESWIVALDTTQTTAMADKPQWIRFLDTTQKQKQQWIRALDTSQTTTTAEKHQGYAVSTGSNAALSHHHHPPPPSTIRNVSVRLQLPCELV